MASSLRELWWVDGSPAVGMSRSALEALALGTLGVVTSQVIPIRNCSAVMVEDFEGLALQVLRLVSPGRTPRAGVMAGWIEDAVAAFPGSGAVRLDVGFSFASGPSDPAPTLIAAITPAHEPATAADPCRLVLASNPSVAFPPFAGLPLAVSAERATLGRTARQRGGADVVLYDAGGLVLDLAANTLVLQRREGLCTPAAHRGAVRTPLRDRLVTQGVLSEMPIDLGVQDDVVHLILTRWGTVVPVASVEDRTLPAGSTAARRLVAAVREALVPPS